MIENNDPAPHHELNVLYDRVAALVVDRDRPDEEGVARLAPKQRRRRARTQQGNRLQFNWGAIIL